MTILCLGLSFRTATIDLREHLSLDRSTVQLALGQFRAWRDRHVGPDAELVVLSTCNRLELYLAASSIPSDQAASALTDFLTSFHGIVGGNIEAHLYRYDQLDAARH